MNQAELEKQMTAAGADMLAASRELAASFRALAGAIKQKQRSRSY